MEKDFSKIRPFDLKAVMAGGKVCINFCKRSNNSLYDEGRYLLGPDANGQVAVEWDGIGEVRGGLIFVRLEDLGMAPLCWLEGVPIYNGDTVYYREGYGLAGGSAGVVTDAYDENVVVQTEKYGICTELLEDMTTKAPKVFKMHTGFVLITDGRCHYKVFDDKVKAEEYVAASPSLFGAHIAQVQWVA